MLQTTNTARTIDVRWYVVQTHARQEARAAANLLRSGVATFLPVATRRSLSREEQKPPPLFPGYLFAQFDVERSLRVVLFTRGVKSIVKVGGDFGCMPDEAIELLRSSAGQARDAACVRPGDRVTIEAGPFASLRGICEGHLSAGSRIAILLSYLGNSVRVSVPADAVRRDL